MAKIRHDEGVGGEGSAYSRTTRNSKVCEESRYYLAES